MALQKRMVARVALGLVLIFLAALVTVVIKDTLAAQHPENALPDIKVYYGEEQVPPEFVVMDHYSWRFIHKTVREENPDRERWMTMEPVWTPAGVPLEVEFSYAPQGLTAWLRPENGAEFVELGGALSAPTEPGVYFLRLLGDWGNRGQIEYNMKILITGDR